jgi:hypothetical protein
MFNLSANRIQWVGKNYYSDALTEVVSMPDIDEQQSAIIVAIAGSASQNPLKIICIDSQILKFEV